jgi:hypothetical protein
MIPRHRTYLDDIDVDRTHVFVPGIMGAGVLLSLGLIVVDTIGRLRGTGSQRREIQLSAAYLTEDVLRSVHRQDEIDPGAGLRPRRTYVLAAVAFLGVAVYGLVGSFWNYVNPVDDGWVEDVAWAWALSNIVVLLLACIGGVLAFIAWRYPDVPPWSRRFLARSPVGRPPAE